MPKKQKYTINHPLNLEHVNNSSKHTVFKSTNLFGPRYGIIDMRMSMYPLDFLSQTHVVYGTV